MGTGFTAVDVRGYSVTCSSYYWDNHVLKHHPGLVGHENDAKRAVEQRSFIYASKSKPDCHIYYGSLTGRRPEIKVVVTFDANHIGTVLSVSECSKRPSEEKIVWPE